MNSFRTCFFFLAMLFVTTNSLQAATTACSSTSDVNFTPSFGQVYVGEDQYSRYIVQYMYWDNYLRLAWPISNADATFEPDALFYNYGDSVGGSAYGVAPSGYWASDLPAAYVDTQAFDSNEEKAVTIGSGQAASLVPQRMYYTVTRMTSGGVQTGWLKLSAQRGRQIPTGCTSTWCSFGCDTSGSFRTMPFNSVIQPTGRSFSAPSCARYWYNWQYSPSPFLYDC